MLNGFDAIIGLDSGLDSVLMKDKVFSIRGRAVSYQVGVSRGQDKNAEIQAAIDKVLASFEDVFTETPYQSVSTLEPRGPGWLSGCTLLSHKVQSAGSNSRKVNGFIHPGLPPLGNSDYGSYDGAERRKRLN